MEMRTTDTSDAPPSEGDDEPYAEYAVAEVTIGRKQGSKIGLSKSSAADTAAAAGRFGGAGGDAKKRDDGLADDDGASSVGDSASDAGDGQDATSTAMSSGEDLHADARWVLTHHLLDARLAEPATSVLCGCTCCALIKQLQVWQPSCSAWATYR
jgi:hypothetical protein